MTPIVTVAAKNKAVQTSDRLLRPLDGGLYHDHKAVTVWCDYSKVRFSATLGEEPEVEVALD